MKIILLEPVENLGDVGAIVTVKPGYARNYLVPEGLALPATPGNIKILERTLQARAKVQAERKSEAERLAEMLRDVVVELSARAGEGKIYGSIGSADVAHWLKANRGIEIDRKRLELGRAIKSLGEYMITYKPHPDVRIPLKVIVRAEGLEA
jgi:large subunit ribosomal protein L9